MNKSGRKDIKNRSLFSQRFGTDPFGNQLQIPDEIKEELKADGLEGRFGDYKKLKEMDGYHPKGWKVYKCKNRKALTKNEFTFGSSPDGTLRRGTVILMARPIPVGDKHRKHLEYKRLRYSQSYRRQKAEELKQAAREIGIEDFRVTEDFGEE